MELITKGHLGFIDFEMGMGWKQPEDQVDQVAETNQWSWLEDHQA